MGRLLKLLGYLVVMLVALIIGYAYIGDLTPIRQDISQPVELDAN